MVITLGSAPLGPVYCRWNASLFVSSEKIIFTRVSDIPGTIWVFWPILYWVLRTKYMRTSSELITVASFETAPEAWIYQNRLEANGITAFVADEHVANAYWLYSTAIGGVKVQIPDREIKSFRRFEVLEATTNF